MNGGILDHIARSQRFAPATPEEYLALQFAKKLRDEAAVKRHLNYLSNHSVEHLMRLFHRVKSEPEPARAFHSSLMSSDS